MNERSVRADHDGLSERVIGACIEIHRQLGPGLLESTYERCLCHELKLLKIEFRRQVSIPVVYKGVLLEDAYRLDLLVDEKLIVEIKSVEALMPLHTAQLLTYLKLADRRAGLLVNFNVPALKLGLRRILNPKNSF